MLVKLKKAISIMFLLTMIVGMTGCKQEEETVKLSCPDDISGYPVGAITGGISASMTPVWFPGGEVFEFPTIADAVAALKQGKIMGVPYDEGACRDICGANEDLTYFGESLMDFDYGSIFNKDEEGLNKRDDYNAFLAELKNAGGLEKIKSKWLSDDCKETFDLNSLTGENGKLVLATDGLAYPYSFSCDGQLTGLEIEIIYRYCLERGYSLEVMNCNFAGILAAISSGKADIGASAIIVTEEREEVFYFSTHYASSSYHLIVRKENMANEFNSKEDLEGKTIADVTGTICSGILRETYDNIKINFYNSNSDIVEAVISGKAAAGVMAESAYSAELKEREDIRILDILGYEECGYFFQKNEKGEALRNEFNLFIKESEENGYMEWLNNKWADESSDKHLDLSELTGENGTIRYACTSVIGAPVCYVYNNEITGKEVEFVFEFARTRGYQLKIEDYSFSGMLQAVSSNMADIGGSNTAITAERAESVNFSDPFYRNPIILIVKNGSASEENTGFIESIKTSFEKTFIKEDRYKLFVEGVLATLEISLVSIICGLLLGILLFALYYMHNPVVNRILDLLSSLLSDTPTVVLLMVFYYIIFSNSIFGGLEVSVVAFSILFSVTVLGILKTCFASVDKGQFEAAWALGYGKLEAILKIIVPEILPMFFTLFMSEIVALIKATSIVGYIAVQDVTKVSDIVRSRTYEPFFPLIVTTVLYILVIILFKQIVVWIADSFNTRKTGKSYLLKGVKKDD